MENGSEWTYSIPNFNNSYTSCDLLSSCSLNMLQNQYGKDMFYLHSLYFKNGKQTRICLLKAFLNKYGKEVFYALQSAFQLRQMKMLIEQIR